MEIKTKFELGDEVWVMHKNNAISKDVSRIIIYVGHVTGFAKGNNKPSTTIIYELYADKNISTGFPEEKVFKTKEKLLESL